MQRRQEKTFVPGELIGNASTPKLCVPGELIGNASTPFNFY